MEHTTRDAQASDSGEMAKLYYLAGKSHVAVSIYDLMVPGPYGMTGDRIDRMARIIAAEAPSWLSYRHYRVIEVDGKVAGGLATFTPEDDSNKDLGKAMMEVGWGVAQMLAMSRRLKVWAKTDTGREPGYLVVENVATFEECRGNGFTSELLAGAIERAGNEDHKGLQLTVMLGNEPAIAVYEKAGFKVEKTRENKKFEKVFSSPGVGQMLLKF
jgi:ribosomal protein S18 acetylase RimI-like enzyme